MLPFSLKVAWMVLSLIGTASCWIVLSAFAHAIDSFWGPLTYCAACTILEVVFSIGMAWRMDPYRMPRAFCITQNILIGFSTFVLTGVCMSLAILTYIITLKPKTWGDQESQALAWRPIFAYTMVGYPLLASAVQIAVSVKLDAVKPTDDFHCDATDPEWVRFLGYATPLLFAIPCLILSIHSIVRTIKTTRHIQRSRSDELDAEHSSPPPRRLYIRRLLRTFSMERVRNSGKAPEIRLEESKSYRNDTDTIVSMTSSSFPNFENSPPSTIVHDEQPNRFDPDFSAVIGEHYSNHERPSDDDDVSSLVWAHPTSSQNLPTGGAGEDVEKDIASQLNDSEPDLLSYGKVSSGFPHKSRRPPPAFLAPSIWRLMMFQLGFSIVLVLSTISTLVDVSLRRPQPAAFGSQHVALLLVAWAPALVFGHLPAVRRRIFFWQWRASTEP